MIWMAKIDYVATMMGAIFPRICNSMSFLSAVHHFLFISPHWLAHSTCSYNMKGLTCTPIPSHTRLHCSTLACILIIIDCCFLVVIIVARNPFYTPCTTLWIEHLSVPFISLTLSVNMISIVNHLDFFFNYTQYLLLVNRTIIIEIYPKGSLIWLTSSTLITRMWKRICSSRLYIVEIGYSHLLMPCFTCLAFLKWSALFIFN